MFAKSKVPCVYLFHHSGLLFIYGYSELSSLREDFKSLVSPCCGTRRSPRRERLRCSSTAATRSGRSSRHWRRSPRFPIPPQRLVELLFAAYVSSCPCGQEVSYHIFSCPSRAATMLRQASMVCAAFSIISTKSLVSLQIKAGLLSSSTSRSRKPQLTATQGTPVLRAVSTSTSLSPT